MTNSLTAFSAVLRSDQTRILVTWDNPLRLRSFTLNLTMQGFTVLEERNGHAGLTTTRTQYPQLLLVDLSSADSPGWQMIEDMHNDPHLAGIPIVAISPDPVVARQRTAFRANVRAIVSTPFDSEALLHLLWQMLTLPAA